MSQVFSKERAGAPVTEYIPKNLDVRSSGIAQGFVDDRARKNKDFEINEMVAEQSGVAEVKRQQVRDDITKKVAEKYEATKEEARQKGFEEGVQQGIQQVYQANEANILEQIDKIHNLAQQFEVLKAEILAQSESEIVKMVYYVASQIAAKEISISPDQIVILLQKITGSLQDDEKINIYINPEDYDFIQSAKDLSKRIVNFQNIKFEADASINRGGAKIKTNFSEVDATIENRTKAVWDNIQKSLPDLTDQDLSLKKTADTSGSDDES